jgi:hypothetical protein
MMASLPERLFMRYLLALLAVCFAVSPALAQITFDAPPSTETNGAIRNQPYDAVKTMHTRKVLGDGTIQVHDYQVREARDSAGRVVAEVQSDLNNSTRAVVSLAMFDYDKREMLQWSSAKKVVILLRLPPTHAPDPAHPVTKPQDLGHRTIDGRDTVGKLSEHTIAAGTAGITEATTTRREWWTDEELHLVVLDKRTDATHGERTTELQSLKLTEPDASRFAPPEGYVVSTLPMPNLEKTSLAATIMPLDVDHVPDIGHDAAMDKLNTGDSKEKLVGAAFLVKEARASNDPTLKEDVASRITRQDIGFKEAQGLAQDAVHAAEADASSETTQNRVQDNFATQIALARDWATLALTQMRLNENVVARQYLESACDLDPQPYICHRLGRLLETMNDNTEAMRVYKLAMRESSASGDDNTRRAVRARIDALESTVPGDPILATALPSVIATADGMAHFDLLYTNAHETPEVVFLSGHDALKTYAVAIAKVGQKAFALPDNGPEVGVRRATVTCKAGGGCELAWMGAHGARKMAKTE